MYAGKGDYNKAITDYTAAIRLSPKYAEAPYKRGVAHSKKGDYDKAIADFTEAARLNPEFASAYYSRGCTYNKKGDHDKAISDYTVAIRLNPTLAKAYDRAGSFVLAERRESQSRRRFRPSREIGNQSEARRAGLSKSDAPGAVGEPEPPGSNCDWAWDRSGRVTMANGAGACGGRVALAKGARKVCHWLCQCDRPVDVPSRCG